MKIFTKAICIALAIALAASAMSGCNKSKDETSSDVFDYSGSLDENGFWKGVEALKIVSLPADTDSIAIPADVSAVADSAIDSEVSSLASKYVESEQLTDRAVADGDTVNIDYVGSVDGVEFSGGTTGGAGTDVTIGVTSYIDDFLEQLIGHMPGDTFNVEVTFPDDYGKDELNGKDAIFVTTINYIVGESITPEINDAFVAEKLASSYGWKTVAEMREGIRKNLVASAEASYIEDYLISNSTFSELPESMLSYQRDSFIAYHKMTATYYNLDFATYISQATGAASEEELLEKNSSSFERAVKYYLVCQAIAEKNSLEAKESDIQSFFTNYIGVDDYSQYEATYGMPYLKMNVLCDLAMLRVNEGAIRA